MCFELMPKFEKFGCALLQYKEDCALLDGPLKHQKFVGADEASGRQGRCIVH
jgi:hypothetical protein